jgi:RNA polymerase sigma-70 factor (ECF subfamily)
MGVTFVEVGTIFPSMKQRRAVPTAAEYRQVLGFVRRRLGRRQDAEDVAQEVFLDMAASLAASTDAAPPTLGWLYTVARRRLADEARRRARSQTVSLEVVPPPEARADPYGAVVARALDEALATLPEGQRRVVVERLLRGRGFAEIGRSVGATEEACRMRFMRGLQQLRRELERRGVEP